MSTDKKENYCPIRPQYDSDAVTIVLTCSENYVWYVCVMLQSILDNLSNNVLYDIVIVHETVSDKAQKLVLQMNTYPNVSIRFHNIAALTEQVVYENDKSFISHVTNETYYRLFVHTIFQFYKKILWLDSDMIVKRDLKELYEIELGDNLLGAVIDASWYAIYNNPTHMTIKKYVSEVLNLGESPKYFQQGVLLINISKFKETFQQQELIEFACKNKCMLYDQDVYNAKCKGKIRFLDMKWNVLADVSGERVNSICLLTPEPYKKTYVKARKDPYIIHYAGGTKPWEDPSIDFAFEFWKIARKTEVYEYLLKDMMKVSAYNSFIMARKIAKHEAQKAIKKYEKVSIDMYR